MKVAVIGAGIAGLYSVKNCVDEGLEPVCFERTEQLGGMWNFKETFEEGDGACVYENLRLNGCVLGHTISDFETDDDRDEFPTAEQHLKYVHKYIQHNQLDKYVRLEHHVLSVTPAEDHQMSGAWLITWRHGDHEQTDRFDAVIVASGRYKKPIIPSTPGLQTFKALYTSNRFKNNRQEELKGKNVLVIGNSFTAGEISASVADTANKVWLSVGKGCSLVGRWTYAPGKVSIDTVFFNRSVIYCSDPIKTNTDLVVDISQRALPDHEKYGLTPGGPALFRPVMISEDLVDKVRDGKVTIKPLAVEVTEDTVRFSDGTEIQPDTIYTATGYEVDFPFLSTDIVADKTPELKLYKLMWPLGHKNMVFVGSTINIFAPYAFFIELQARWAAAVLAGRSTLPGRDDMLTEIETRRKNVIKNFGCDHGQSGGFSTVYMDFMAGEIGALAKWWTYLLTDPYLAYVMRYGPLTSCQYRLVGPHSWPQARRRAIEQYEAWREQKGDGWQWNQMIGIGMAVFAGAVALAASIYN